MTARPPDFEPLASGDPVPGDTGEIAALGRRYTDTAAEIAAQAANLRKLASGTVDGWQGQAAKVFQSHAADLATRIAKAQGRYATAGQALTRCAAPMYSAQQDAYAAVWQAKSAQQQMTANTPGPPPPPGSKPPTAQEKAAAARRQASYDSASSALSTARRHFETAVQDYQNAASAAAKAIEAEISHDGLKDSWWDRNFGWISKVFMVVAIVVAVLAIVALILICPLTAGLLVGIMGITAEGLAATAAVLEWVIFGLTVTQAIFDGISAGTGKESWTSFTLDMVSLATFGLGDGLPAFKALPEIKGVLPRLLEPLAQGAETAAKGVAAGRAGRAAMAEQGLPGLLYSLGSRSGLAAKLLDAAGQGGKLDTAVSAAKSATGVLEKAVQGAEPGNLVTLLSMSADSAETWDKLSIIDEKVPGVVRVIVPRVATAGLIGLQSGAQWGMFTGGNAYNVYSWTHSDTGAVDQTIGQFRQMLGHVPAP